ncbi:MAG: transposase [Nitrospirae bacterium]|nr:transposase [Nitrospirota bacterium]
MKYNPDIHHRRSIRLKEYDYSQAGAYFVTICTQNRDCTFGDIVGREMRLNDAGRMVEIIWNDLPGHNDNIELDEFIVMPNHFHGIIFIVGACSKPLKTYSARRINQIRDSPGIPVWQRNYYEHIIRNETELEKIREYIVSNPLNWEQDENYK